MSPPISKDWWLAAALTGAALPNAMAQTPPTAGQGLITSYETGKPSTTQPLYVTAAAGQRVTTGPGQTAHVLFPDQSAITLGPNTEIVISKYEFDSRSRTGNLAVSMTKGLLRVVGGFVSKNEPIRVSTPTATVGIRGGISTLQFDPNAGNSGGGGGAGNNLIGAFLFGIDLQMFDLDGNPMGMLNRPGSGFAFGPPGGGVQIFAPLQLPPLFQTMLGFLNFNPNFGGINFGPGPGTLPGEGNSDNLSSDRLPTNTDVGSPNQGGTNNPVDTQGITRLNATGGAGPGNQS